MEMLFCKALKKNRKPSNNNNIIFSFQRPNIAAKIHQQPLQNNFTFYFPPNGAINNQKRPVTYFQKSITLLKKERRRSPLIRRKFITYAKSIN